MQRKQNSNHFRTKITRQATRISLYEMFVKGKDLNPDCIFDIRKIKVHKPGSAEYDKWMKHVSDEV